jgi:ubiquinone/menaquinone biosynthesis C-methylase UbiE
LDALRKEMRDRWDEKGGNYDEGHHGIGDPKEIETWRNLFVQCPGGTKILDVGTGTGFVSLIAAECGLAVTALDWSRTMLDQAAAKAKAQNLAINFVQGLTETLPFKEGAFQLLSARHVMWTLADPVQAFREWHRVLAAEGAVWADYSPRTSPGSHYREEVELQLPLNRDIPAEAIEDLFRQAGFSRVIHRTEERVHSHDACQQTKIHYFFTAQK